MYILYWHKDGKPMFLMLSGVFEYPFAVEEQERATQMLRSKAYRYKDILGGEVAFVG